MLEWRLRAYRHWLTMREPTWANVHYPPIDYQGIRYYSAPKSRTGDPEEPVRRRSGASTHVRKTGHSAPGARSCWLAWQSMRSSTACPWRRLFARSSKQLGIYFCSFSEAVQRYPDLVRQYLGSVVPYTDNFFATLNSAVFSDGSFVYVPKGVRCPLELSTYFRINAQETGQFERTLIVADEGSYVSYLEGCTAPMRDRNQLHAAVVELVAFDDAQIRYATVQNWYPGDKEGRGGIYNFVTKRGKCQGVNSKNFVDAGRNRVRDHVEVPRLHSYGRQLIRSVLLRGCDQQLSAGRHRHEDDPHRQEHEEHDHLERNFGRPRAELLSRHGEGSQERRRTPAITRNAIRC